VELGAELTVARERVIEILGGSQAKPGTRTPTTADVRGVVPARCSFCGTASPGCGALFTTESGDVTRGDKQRWALDRQVRLLAGSVALASVLASTVVPKAKWIAAGVGVGLVYVAITDTCPITPFMAKLPYNRADPCDVAGVLAALNHQAA
jgi:hypothetical protein